MGHKWKASPKHDISGTKFGRLTVVEYHGRDSRSRSLWNCLCECSNRITIRGDRLVSGNTKSCGCLAKESNSLAPRNVKHGKRTLAEYGVWANMKRRCTNPKAAKYKDYGGRGITVCERWMKFENFFEDMGKRPSAKHSIHRVNNDGPYCKSNCEWTTNKNQARVRRSSSYITANGITLTKAEWEERLGMHRGFITTRVRRGMTPEEAVTVHIRKYSNKH